MSTTADPHANASTAAPPAFTWLPRLGSLLAFVPLGVWTAWHLWDNTYAFRGASARQQRVASDRSPFVEMVTVVVVMLPLLLHTVWGIRRLFIVRPNVARYPTFDNLKFALQRLSAVGLLAFLPAHVYLARIEPALRSGGGHEHFTLLASAMNHHTPTLVVYVLGILATAYHLGNGIATGGLTWGYTASPRAMRTMGAVSIGAFLLLLAMGWGSVFALYTAGASIPYVGDESGSQAPAATDGTAPAPQP